MDNNEIKSMYDNTKNFKPQSSFEKKWIENGIDGPTIDYSKKLGFYLCNYYWNDKFKKIDSGKGALSNSQIRNVFGEVKRIQMKLKGTTDKEKAWKEIKSSFLLLQPKLAYASGRAVQKQKQSVLPVLKDVLTQAAIAVKADDVGAAKRYENFVDFLESILAYHKTYGGKEN